MFLHKIKQTFLIFIPELLLTNVGVSRLQRSVIKKLCSQMIIIYSLSGRSVH